MTENAPQDAQPGTRPRVLLIGVVGSVLLWLAQPPMGWWPLAWVGPAFWLWLANQPTAFGRREYTRVWLAAAVYWLLALNWVCRPHPLTPIGLPFLAAYLALYGLATVGLIRLARRRWRAPLWLAAPISWVGMEFLQARLFTGFLMGAVSHSQAGQPWLRSIAAWVGAYGVTFVVIVVAATVATAFRGWQRPPLIRDVLGVVAAILMAVGIGGAARWSIAIEGPRPTPARVALIQGDSRATWDPDPGRGQRIMDRQVALTAQANQQARSQGKRLDLVVWPESMFRSWLFTFDGSMIPPPDVNDSTRAVIDSTEKWFESLTSLVDGATVIAGIDRFDWRDDAGGEPTSDVYNSVAIANGRGEVEAIYDKTHLVPFGEYIPFAQGLPALYYLTPMSGGLNAGTGPVPMRVELRNGETLRLSPSICYESVVPRVIRRQVAELIASDERPDALLNVTNDAWFWGSSELDMHLACGVFRAVENGTPLLVAANGGLSAVVEATGEVLEVSPRMAEHVIVAEVPPKSVKPTPYTLLGDWFAGGCLLACVVGVLAPTFTRWRNQSNAG